MSKVLIGAIVGAQFALAVLRKRVLYESSEKYAAVLFASVFGHGLLLNMGCWYASVTSFLMSIMGARMVVVEEKSRNFSGEPRDARKIW